MNTQSYNVRIDKKDHDKAQEIFSELGIDFTTGIRMYIKQVIKTNGIPFELSAELNSIDRGLRDLETGNYAGYESSKELFEELDGE